MPSVYLPTLDAPKVSSTSFSTPRSAPVLSIMRIANVRFSIGSSMPIHQNQTSRRTFLDSLSKGLSAKTQLCHYLPRMLRAPVLEHAPTRYQEAPWSVQ